MNSDKKILQEQEKEVYTGKIKTEPTRIKVEYDKGVQFNETINLYEIVEENNDFYNSRQWGGLKTPHLDKPVLNILKPAVNYYIAQIVSDDVGIDIGIKHPDNSVADFISEVLQSEIENIMEQTNTSTKNRQLLRNMAVDGDAVLYSYYDIETSGIQTEIAYNTDIIFGNPIESEIQKQPYIIYKQRLLLDEVKEYAEENGVSVEGIVSDNEEYIDDNTAEIAEEYVTVFNKFWKDKGVVWYTKTTANVVLKEPVKLGYRLYPFAYRSWEEVRNCYHGVAPITGVISNQIMINKIYAAASAYTMSYAFPKILYDKAKLPQGWNNDPTKAIACNGDPTTAIFSTFKAADMSGQVVQLVDKILEETKDALGVYDAALGNVNPTNTSAIVATQKAAAAPLDLQKLNFYQMFEDEVRIWIDIMANNYGIRQVDYQAPQEGEQRQQASVFDFSQLANLRYRLKIEVGASTYWNELAQVQTMDNLMNLQILPDAISYLESLPNGYVRDREKLIEQLRQKYAMEQQAQQQQAMQQQEMMAQKMQMENETKAIENADKQADVMKKMQELKTITKQEMQYQQSEIDGARVSGIDSSGVLI